MRPADSASERSRIVGRVDGRVVGDPIHHHLADDGPDAVRLGRPERGVEARLVDRPVDQRGRRARRGEGAPGERREPLGGRRVEPALEREDVAVEPGQQVETRRPGRHSGSGAGGRAGRPCPAARPTAAGRARRRGPRRGPFAGRGAGVGQPAGAVDDDQAVGLVERAAVIERGQQPGAERERRCDGQVHGRAQA